MNCYISIPFSGLDGHLADRRGAESRDGLGNLREGLQLTHLLTRAATIPPTPVPTPRNRGAPRPGRARSRPLRLSPSDWRTRARSPPGSGASTRSIPPTPTRSASCTPSRASSPSTAGRSWTPTGSTRCCPPARKATTSCRYSPSSAPSGSRSRPPVGDPGRTSRRPADHYEWRIWRHRSAHDNPQWQCPAPARWSDG